MTDPTPPRPPIVAAKSPTNVRRRPHHKPDVRNYKRAPTAKHTLKGEIPKS